jgi:hypothetical protein
LEDGDYEWACFAAIRRKSFGSVVVYSVDRVAVEEALDRFVAACREREEVLAVVLFGSFARGGFGVGSDVDLLLILRESPLPFPDRIPLYRPVDFPIDVDVFPTPWRRSEPVNPLPRKPSAPGGSSGGGKGWMRRRFHRRRIPPQSMTLRVEEGEELSPSGHRR